MTSKTSNLKGILFSQYASEGLSRLVEELQAKYKPKKGRRFNHNNVTYEIGRPTLKGSKIEFEISSKIPEDEVTASKEMKTYFAEIKKIINAEKHKPAAIEMENIVWDSKKDTEKERDYVKLLYQYSLDELYDEAELRKRCELVMNGVVKEELPKVSGIFTVQGKIALLMVRETVQKIARDHVNALMNANKKVRS